MKLRLPKRQPGTPSVEAPLVQFCGVVDRSIPVLRTILIIAGLLAAAARLGPIGDFLFVTGMLFQLSMWFQHWWIAKRTL
ncbi:hypothetical protein [Massilia phyllosphaerae]|uniref:hypothetical protein n=1 Tax=Massilia phyllosphaerae TaxID=3106034 RepID=UPI002B1CB44F|nr:hypothetical protein [Massilia sp. SGZ-792]